MKSRGLNFWKIKGIPWQLTLVPVNQELGVLVDLFLFFFNINTNQSTLTSRGCTSLCFAKAKESSFSSSLRMRKHWWAQSKVYLVDVLCDDSFICPRWLWIEPGLIHAGWSSATELYPSTLSDALTFQLSACTKNWMKCSMDKYVAICSYIADPILHNFSGKLTWIEDRSSKSDSKPLRYGVGMFRTQTSQWTWGRVRHILGVWDSLLSLQS